VSLTISTIINGTLSLIRSYNPVTITFTGGVKRRGRDLAANPERPEDKSNGEGPQ
jgi:hypothetical protein